jgi:ATP-binding cassette subfamily B (MDR/TAP) protein 1
MVSFLELFRFADKTDKILMFFGTIGALLIGAAMPMFAFLWGTMTTAFG